jgi:hypothetical protein
MTKSSEDGKVKTGAVIVAIILGGLATKLLTVAPWLGGLAVMALLLKLVYPKEEE